MPIKTTITFDHSPDAVDDMNRGTPGKYIARVFVADPEKKKPPREINSLEILGTENNFVVEGEEGQEFSLFIVYANPDGVYSPATPHQFCVSAKVPPRRPTNPRVRAANPTLPVLSGGCGTGCGCAGADSEPKPLITVTGHDNIFDGAVGTVLGVHETTGVVTAVFEESALKDGGVDTQTYEFNPLDESVTVIMPDQTTLQLAEFVEKQLGITTTMEVTKAG